MEGSAGPTEGAAQPSPVELTSSAVGPCASTALRRPGWIRPSWGDASVCPSAPAQGASCLVGMRPEPAELYCGLGFPAPAVPPKVFPWGCPWCEQNPRHLRGCSGSSAPPQLCQLMGRAGRCTCCCLKGSAEAQG